MAKKNDFYVGIDVGGPKKGFCLAALTPGDKNDETSPEIFAIFGATRPLEICEHIRVIEKTRGGRVRSIGIDAPPRASIKGPPTRLAERELNQAGYKIQWTPRNKSQESGWMQNGEALWEALARNFPRAGLFETFPTAISDTIFTRDYRLPLRIFAGKNLRKRYPDYLDACLAAYAAHDAFEKRTTLYGASLKNLTKTSKKSESVDELGPIAIPLAPGRDYTLCLLTRPGQILLGLKKRGFGKGYWNGFGGKVHTGETIKAAAIREVQEEAGLRVKKLREVGRLYFSFAGQEELMRGHVFHCEEFEGEPTESDEMRPAWFDIARIPFQKMWSDDRYWFAPFLEGRSFTGHFHFNDSDDVLAYSLEIHD